MKRLARAKMGLPALRHRLMYRCGYCKDTSANPIVSAYDLQYCAALSYFSGAIFGRFLVGLVADLRVPAEVPRVPRDSARAFRRQAAQLRVVSGVRHNYAGRHTAGLFRNSGLPQILRPPADVPRPGGTSGDDSWARRYRQQRLGRSGSADDVCRFVLDRAILDCVSQGNLRAGKCIGSLLRRPALAHSVPFRLKEDRRCGF